MSWAEKVQSIEALLRYYAPLKEALATTAVEESSESQGKWVPWGHVHPLLSVWVKVCQKVLKPMEKLCPILQLTNITTAEAKQAALDF